MVEKSEVSPRDEMANSQGMQVFDVERHGLPEDFVYFRIVWCAIVAARICSESCVRVWFVTGI